MNPYSPTISSESPTRKQIPSGLTTLFGASGLVLVAILSIVGYFNIDWAILGSPFIAAAIVLMPLSRVSVSRGIRVCILALSATLTVMIVCLADSRGLQPVYQTIDLRTFLEGFPWLMLAGVVAAVLTETVWAVFQALSFWFGRRARKRKNALEVS